MSKPSPFAIAMLRASANELDVIDVVDLCYAKEASELRVTIYLESLRGRSGEAAQVAACLLCFDLARRGDERCAQEVALLLPTLDPLIKAHARGEHTVVRDLTETSITARALWDELSRQALSRDARDAELLEITIDLDQEAIEIALFDEDEFSALSIELQGLDMSFELDDAVLRAFDDGLNACIPQAPRLLFAADDAHDLARVEKLREHTQSYSAKLPIAAELHAMTQLFLATHTRALGLFSRRNRRRDRALVEGLTALLSLPTPPTEAVQWFATSDLPGADAQAWPKLAEVLLELIMFIERDKQDNPQRYGAELSQDAWAKGVAQAFTNDARSAKIPQRLADGADRRRR